MRNRKNRSSRTVLLAGACLLWSLGCLMVPRAMAMRYTGCVSPCTCYGYPLGGASCLVIFPDDGSTAANSGLEAEAESCAYVDSQGATWGWPCGGAFPCEIGC